MTSKEHISNNNNSSAPLWLTVEVPASCLQNNAVTAQEIPELISMVHASLEKLEDSQNTKPTKSLKPAVPIKIN